MGYLYETHLHTSQASACAGSQGADYISVYQDLGYAGIFVTDHFFHGNSCLNKNLPWAEWVKRFCAGYEDALNEGLRRGFDVFFGWEETFEEGDDYLVYGLDKNWLLGHPEARNWGRKRQYETICASGGCVVQAHPFRQRYYISKVCLSTVCVDGVEAANACNEESNDALAMRYGQRLGFPVTAGSDIHSTRQALEGQVFGVSLGGKLKNSGDFVMALKEKKIGGLHIPQGRCTLKGGENVALPVDIRGKNDRPAGNNWRELLDL